MPFIGARKNQLPKVSIDSKTHPHYLQHFNLISERRNTPMIGSIWILILASIMLIPDSENFFYIIDFVSPFTYVSAW